MFNALMGILIAIAMIGSAILIGILQEMREELGWEMLKKGKKIIKLCNIGIVISVVIMITSIVFFFQYLSITLFTIIIN